MLIKNNKIKLLKKIFTTTFLLITIFSFKTFSSNNTHEEMRKLREEQQKLRHSQRQKERELRHQQREEKHKLRRKQREEKQELRQKQTDEKIKKYALKMLTDSANFNGKGSISISLKGKTLKYENNHGAVIINGEKQDIERIIEQMISEKHDFKGTGLILISLKTKNESVDIKYDKKASGAIYYNYTINDGQGSISSYGGPGRVKISTLNILNYILNWFLDSLKNSWYKLIGWLNL